MPINMKDGSILNDIITDTQLNDLASLNLATIVDQLLAVLNPREQDVLRRRYGLSGVSKETLESIGQEHKLTRERIRQIETVSVNKIKKNPELEALIGRLRQVITHLLDEHGGVVDKEYLFSLLYSLAKMQNVNHSTEEYRNHLNFLTGRIINDHFDEIGEHSNFNELIKVKYQNLDHLEEVAEEVITQIREAKALVATDDLIALITNMDSYKKHEDKFQAPNQLDFSRWLKEALPDYTEEIWNNRVVYSLVQAIKHLNKNKFGQWGHSAWREVMPKTINDKIYLVLKNEAKPMYYGDIAKKITELGFDTKVVNTATTHNELILDDKYVLVGRGMYGLKEWGYQNGTVADVVESILQAKGEPMAKDDIMSEVLKQRMVKETTVNLALMNKTRFTKNSEGKYILAEKK